MVSNNVVDIYVNSVISFATVSTTSTLTVIITAPSGSSIDLASATDLVITIEFTDTEIPTTMGTCSVLEPSIGTNVCTWNGSTDRKLIYTGTTVGTSVWASGSDMTFSFSIDSLTLPVITTLSYTIDIYFASLL
jgi:hypothetical protein